MQMMKSPKEMSSMELPQDSDGEAEFDEEGEQGCVCGNAGRGIA
jgi:hypothetical protein